MIDRAVKEVNSQLEDKPDTIRFKIYRGQSPEGESIFEVYESSRARAERLRIIDTQQVPPDNIYHLHLENQAAQVQDFLDLPQTRWHHSNPSRFYTAIKAMAAAGLIAFLGGIYAGYSSVNDGSRQIETTQPEKKTLEHVARASLPRDIVNHDIFDPEYLRSLQVQAKENAEKSSQIEQARFLVDTTRQVTDKISGIVNRMIIEYRDNQMTLASLDHIEEGVGIYNSAPSEQQIKGTQYCIELFKGDVKEAAKYSRNASKRASLSDGVLEVREQGDKMAVLFYKGFISIDEAKEYSALLNAEFHYHSKAIQFVHPEKIIDTIIRVAEKEGVDPNLALLVAEKESRFWQYSKSSAGARGVFQLMPQVVLDMARDDGAYTPAEYKSLLRKEGEEDKPWQNRILLSLASKGINLYDVETNSRYAIRKIKGETDFFDNLRTALASYNAGRKNVLKYEGIPPFAETRNFVRKIHGVYVADLAGHLEDMLDQYQCDSLKVRKS